MPDNPLPSPDYRATIAGGVLTVVPWISHLVGHGPSAVHARARAQEGIALVDLTVQTSVPAPLDAREITAVFLCAPAGSDAAKAVIADWAAAVGYRRVWFNDEIRDLSDHLPGLGEVASVCSTCRARWVESNADFWLGVRRAGMFPTTCPICGGLLPQWSEAHHPHNRAAHGDLTGDNGRIALAASESDTPAARDSLRDCRAAS